MMQPFQLMPDPDGNMIAVLNGVKDGVPYNISATDSSMTETELRAIVP